MRASTRAGFAALIAGIASCAERPAPVRSSPPPAAAMAPATAPIASASSERWPGPSPPENDLAAEATLALPIAARSQAKESPPQGWCGETAIQEGLLYLGVWAPQRIINRAGKPVHPDLDAPEIPVARGELGVRFAVYSRGRGFESFARWVREALEAGDPVLAGVKILPTAHPEWGLDHFVLVVGHGTKGLLVNTTWGSRAWVGDTSTPGLSLANAFYGLRLSGVALPRGARPARLTLLEESADAVKVRVTCTGLTPGAPYRMQRWATRSDEKPIWSEPATAEADQLSKELTVDAARPSRFECIPN